jgi:hypothetical protein
VQSSSGGLGFLCVVFTLSLLAGGCGDDRQTGGDTPPKDVRAISAPEPAGGSRAREAGRRACSGLTAREAARRYRDDALRAGVRRSFAALVADPPDRVAASRGYPRLVAALYATTVAAPARREAAAGCAQELAAPSGGGRASSTRTGQEELPLAGSNQQKGNE